MPTLANSHLIQTSEEIKQGEDVESLLEDHQRKDSAVRSHDVSATKANHQVQD